MPAPPNILWIIAGGDWDYRASDIIKEQTMATSANTPGVVTFQYWQAAPGGYDWSVQASDIVDEQTLEGIEESTNSPEIFQYWQAAPGGYDWSVHASDIVDEQALEEGI